MVKPGDKSNDKQSIHVNRDAKKQTPVLPRPRRIWIPDSDGNTDASETPWIHYSEVDTKASRKIPASLSAQ